MSGEESERIRHVARPRNFSTASKRASFDDRLEDSDSSPAVNGKIQGSASLDDLQSMNDEPSCTVLSRSSGDRYKSIPRMQAPPPTEDGDEYLFVQGKTAPLSMIDDDLNDLGDGRSIPCGSGAISNNWESERVVFKLGVDNDVILEMPITPIEIPPWHNAMQNSVKIEPSPERTLEREKRKNRDDTDGRSATHLLPVDPQIIEQKLNTFFGESKSGFTELESSVYKSLVMGPSGARVHNESGNLPDQKLKKSSASSHFASRITNLYPSTNQLKTTKKVSEPSVSKSKDRKAWRGIVSRPFNKRHTTSSDTSEDGSVATFGVPLDMCPTSKEHPLVPLIVEVCVHIVDKDGADCQGIYRVPGHSASVTELVEEVNHGDPAYIKTENERWSDVNVVGSLLKLFFRKLPEALITDRLYESFIATVRSTGNQEKSALRLKRLLRELPEQNCVTLHFLVEHLARISMHQASNKMDAHNLAMMFGPSLVRPTEESMTNMVKDIPDQSAVVERLILQYDWYFGDWTEDATIPVDLQPIEPSASMSSNLQLLANAESLVAQMAQDAASSSQADDSPSFFKLGSHRQSRKNKTKVEKDASELDEFNSLPDLNREVELRRLRIASSSQKSSSSSLQQPESKGKELSPGLTRADLARKVSISLKNKKVKRRYTERPNVNDIRIMFDHSSEPGAKSKPADADRDVSKSENVSVQQTKAAPETRSTGRREPVVEIKRYPAYNFVDTTIKLSSSSSFKKIPSQESVEFLPDVLPHAYSTLSLLPHTKSKPRAVDKKQDKRERMEDWLPPSRGDVCSDAVDGSRSDEDVFHSSDAAPVQDSLSSSSATSTAVECRYHTIASPYRHNKRFSETDASRYTKAVAESTSDICYESNNLLHKYDVVIRAPEGRRYYVLVTDKPSLFFDKSKDGKHSVLSRNVPKPRPRLVENLSVNEIMMARMDRAGSLCLNAGVMSPEDIELRKIPSAQLFTLGAAVMTCV